jgi:aspartate/methionine/tyrosine aminotransferase
LCEVLDRVGFDVYVPDGTYFIMAGHERVSGRLGLADDVALCRHLTSEVGVAAIPPSFFYEDRSHGKGLVRFAFCKRMETLREAARRSEGLRG